jgi:hypothetical protein
MICSSPTKSKESAVDIVFVHGLGGLFEFVVTRVALMIRCIDGEIRKCQTPSPSWTSRPVRFRREEEYMAIVRREE